MLASIDIRIEKPRDNNFRVYMLILATLLLALIMIFLNQQESYTSVGRLVQGQPEPSQQFGVNPIIDFPMNSVKSQNNQPTAISLINFNAQLNPDGSIILSWETGVEINHAGFHVYRASEQDGALEQITAHLIPAQGDLVGTAYTYTDHSELSTGYVFYTLEEVDNNNITHRYGPLAICIGCDQISMP